MLSIFIFLMFISVLLEQEGEKSLVMQILTPITFLLWVFGEPGGFGVEQNILVSIFLILTNYGLLVYKRSEIQKRDLMILFLWSYCVVSEFYESRLAYGLFMLPFVLWMFLLAYASKMIKK